MLKIYIIARTMFNECQNTIHTSILGCELPFGLCQQQIKVKAKSRGPSINFYWLRFNTPDS